MSEMIVLQFVVKTDNVHVSVLAAQKLNKKIQKSNELFCMICTCNSIFSSDLAIIAGKGKDREGGDYIHMSVKGCRSMMT